MLQKNHSESFGPICVDLDGTLIYEDVTMVAMRSFIHQNWWNIFLIVLWFLRGRAYLKHCLAETVEIDPASLTYNQKLLDFLCAQMKSGARLILATACDQKYANVVAKYVGIFDTVIASNGIINLRAQAKAAALCQLFGERNFVYIGNSFDDVFVWKHSRKSILVNPSKMALYFMSDKEYEVLV